MRPPPDRFVPTFSAHLSAVDVRAKYQRSEMSGRLLLSNGFELIPIRSNGRGREDVENIRRPCYPCPQKDHRLTSLAKPVMWRWYGIPWDRKRRSSHQGLICHQEGHLGFHARIAKVSPLFDVERLDQGARAALFYLDSDQGIFRMSRRVPQQPFAHQPAKKYLANFTRPFVLVSSHALDIWVCMADTASQRVMP